MTGMMISRTKYYLLLFIVLQAPGTGVFGQQKDFQSWYEASLEKGLKNGLDLSGELELRLDGNSSRYDRSMFTLGAGYDLNDHLGVDGGARMLMVADRESRINPKYRIHADVVGKSALGAVDLSLRVRFQYGFEAFIYFNDLRYNSLVNRVRVKAAYHIFGTRFSLFGSAENWGLMTDNNGHFFRRMKYSAGTRFALNFRSELNLRYVIEDEFNRVNPLQSYIVVIGYSYKL